MKRWIAIMAVLGWIGLLGIGVFWVARPYVWIQHQNPTATIQMAQRAFPLHLARFPPSETGSRIERVVEDEIEISEVDHSAVRWAYREMRNRFIVSFIAWMGIGFLLRWILGRFIKGEQEFAD